MSKKQDNSQLIAQLETLSNKELHAKCLNYGMNVPVADSSRDVIIRKLVKSITGTAIPTPKASKKQVNIPASPSERRKTVNVTVHVPDEEDETQLRSRGSNRDSNANTTTKAKARTQSPQSATANINNNRRTIAASTVAATNTKDASTAGGRKKYESHTNRPIGSDINVNNTHTVPMDIGFQNDVKRNDFFFEVRRTTSDSNNENITRNPNLNQGIGSNQMFNSAYQSVVPTLSSSTPNVPLENIVRPAHTSFSTSPLLPGHTQPYIGYQEQQQRQQNISTIAPQQTFGYNRPIGFNTAIEPRNSFTHENIASHSSSLAGVTKRNTFDSVATAATHEPIFKRPPTLSTTNVTTNSYNQEDAQRLYPRLPTDLNAPYISSSAATAPEQQPSRNVRAPSLSKSGVLTTSYHQEVNPLDEGENKEIEYEEDDIGASGDYEYVNAPAYDRGKYLSTTQRRTDQLPFEPRLQSTFRNNLNTSTRYSESLGKPVVSPTLNTYSSARSSTASHTTYTNSVDEPDSPSEDEASAHESDLDEYVTGTKKIYSSYGSNKFQERVPYRRTIVGSSPSVKSHYDNYNESPITTRRRTLNADDDDVNAKFINFWQTLDRKYHIKHWIYMFLLFIAAVFVYVFFVQTDESNISMHLTKKQQ